VLNSVPEVIALKLYVADGGSNSALALSEKSPHRRLVGSLNHVLLDNLGMR
jgi:hypothetical protein